MSTDTHHSKYSPHEELANGITHGVGIPLSIGGLAVLATFAARFGDVWHIVSCSVFGAALILIGGVYLVMLNSIQHPSHEGMGPESRFYAVLSSAGCCALAPRFGFFGLWLSRNGLGLAAAITALAICLSSGLVAA